MSDYVQNICDSFRSNSKAMSWLIVGGAGMGKMDLVRSIAQNLLGTQGMTSGFKVLECGLTEEVKKKIQKEILEGRSVENPSDEDRKSEITVEDVRQTLGFLSLKTSLPCKILVVSLAENMNINAQNAFLKTLEEPFEKTLIFLLTENPARLLPTILSRCQKIYLNPMTVNELVDKIKQNQKRINILTERKQSYMLLLSNAQSNVDKLKSELNCLKEQLRQIEQNEEKDNNEYIKQYEYSNDDYDANKNNNYDNEEVYEDSAEDENEDEEYEDDDDDDEEQE
jgi:DNA polymerase III gamma/tau subunit